MLLRRLALAGTHAIAGGLAYRVGYRTGVNDAQDPATAFEKMVAREQAMKEDLLDHLRHHAYVKLGPSSIAGVGVFALVDIAAGVDPFAG